MLHGFVSPCLDKRRRSYGRARRWLIKTQNEGSAVPLLTVDDVHDLFQISNIDSGYIDFNLKVLDAVLSETEWQPPDLLTLSLTEEPQRLAVVSRAGIALGAGKGVFKLRVDVESFSYSTITKFVREHDSRYGSALEAVGVDSTQLFRINWLGMGGFTKDPKAERDRVFNAVLAVWEVHASVGEGGGSDVRGGA